MFFSFDNVGKDLIEFRYLFQSLTTTDYYHEIFSLPTILKLSLNYKNNKYNDRYTKTYTIKDKKTSQNTVQNVQMKTFVKRLQTQCFRMDQSNITMEKCLKKKAIVLNTIYCNYF